MKKILLLGLMAMTTYGTSVFAQQKTLIGSQPEMMPAQIHKGTPIIKSAESNKHTRATSRWYSPAYAVGQMDGTNLFDSDHSNYNYLWQDSTLLGNFGGTHSAIWVKSLYQVIDPRAYIFNDPASFGGEMQITKTSQFSVDSIFSQFAYFRNPNNASVVDTLIVTVSKGNSSPSDLLFWKESQPFVNNYSADTIDMADASFDFATNTLAKSIGSIAYTIKIPMDQAFANDTLQGGWNYVLLGIPGLQNLPANSLPVVTMNFKSGSSWVANVDSASTSGNGKNYMLFASSRENAPAGFRYATRGDYNVSGMMKNDTTGWDDMYIPSYYFNSPAYEFHWFEWKLSCPTCLGVGVNDVTIFNDIKAYPNPATDQLSVVLNLKEDAKNVTLEVTNTLGQVVKTVELGNVRANQTTGQVISISDLSKGMYIYTINANNQKISNKLMVN
ncbi:MAG TPA: T9SS type A sorting domain-containing protein [Chitinophagaceae bacterium]|nr:T9SS type A sorting domain-containing protein [Chitinophagaceae bacterium]